MHGGLTFEWFDMCWYLSKADEHYDIWTIGKILFLAKFWDIHKMVYTWVENDHSVFFVSLNFWYNFLTVFL